MITHVRRVEAGRNLGMASYHKVGFDFEMKGS